MLSSFYGSYLLFIEICGLLCLLVNLYNFARYLSSGARERIHKKRVGKVLALLTAGEEDDSKAYAKESQDRKPGMKLTRLLRRTAYVRTLSDALLQKGWSQEEGIPCNVRIMISAALASSLQRYDKMDDPIRALVVSVGSRSGMSTGAYRRFLLACLSENPMYLRIAALRGCAEQGSEELMLQALRFVDVRQADFSIKLLTDVLMLYQNRRDHLFEVMWRKLPNYSQNLVCAFLAVLTNEKDAGFAKRILGLMTDGTADMEVRIAAIKYFEQVPYPAAQEQIVSFLSAEDWEYAAVAARVLRQYDCQNCGEPLLKSLSSRNWYVRYNSAMTLVKNRPDLIEAAESCDDRYARDIVRYALDVEGGTNA